MSELNQSISFIRRRLKPYIEVIDEYTGAEDQELYYEIIKKKKRRGGYRYLYVCMNSKLRSAHKVIYEMLRDYQSQVLPCAHGFIKHKSTYTNAKNHTRQPYILHLDIKDFFDSILVSQVEAALLRLGVSKDVAELVSKLATVNGVMRQGLHTSPDLSNHCLYAIDKKLSAYATSNGMKYSRYGDDITISGSQPPNVDELRSIIEVDGFQLNESKIKLQKRGSNQYVTGLTVFDDVPRIPRSFKKRLRSHLYYIDKLGFEEHVKRTRGINRDDFDTDEEYEHVLAGLLHGTAKYIIGHVSYVNSVEPKRAKPMWTVLNEHKVRDYL
jgi:RNA-directed DNA polymerase